jgi:membrane protein DedA with SNARE-associated domain/membrane-associated phospholipid phosphatase
VAGLIDTLTRLSSPWAYVVVGLLATAEAVFVGLVLPGELVLLLGGFLAYQGRVSLAGMVAVAAVAAVAGYLVGYATGRRLGPALRTGGLGRRIGPARWDRVQAVLAARGGQAIFLGRFVGLLRALMPAAAGTARMPYPTFVVWTVAGGLIWAPGFVLLGYLAGGSYQRVADLAGQASLILLALLVLVGGVLAAARWTARHPDQVRALLARQLERPAVAALRRRYGSQLGFLARRFSPQGALGLSLTVGLAAVVGFGWLFGGITEDVIKGDELAARDSPVAAWLAEHRVGWLTATMRAITQLGSLRLIAPLVALTALLLLVRARRPDAAALLVTAVTGASLLVVLVKLLIGRARPEGGGMLVLVDSSSFPSAHSAQAVATYGALAYLAGRAAPRWGQRVAAWTTATLIALLVGFSRLYLGVHWLSDVLGGYALGAGWLAIVITATATYQRLRSQAPPPEERQQPDDQPKPTGRQDNAREANH